MNKRMVMRQPSSKPGLLTLTIKDKSALYLAYMPFVKNGGLFIPTNSNYRLGDEVFMLLNLMGEDEKLPVAGRVIWMTPKGAQGKRTAGIGVQFSEQDRGNTQRKIESYLAGALGGVDGVIDIAGVSRGALGPGLAPRRVEHLEPAAACRLAGFAIDEVCKALHAAILTAPSYGRGWQVGQRYRRREADIIRSMGVPQAGQGSLARAKTWKRKPSGVSAR